MVQGEDGESLIGLIEGVFNLNNVHAIIMTSKGETWSPIIDPYPHLEGAKKSFGESGFTVARVSSSISRKNSELGAGPSTIHIGDLVIHPERREVLVNGTKVTLTYTEFGILLCLAERPGWVFTNGQILEAVRGLDHNTQYHSLTVHMTALRRKLGPAGKYIETERGVGYRLNEGEGGRP
jgi:two-component system phosphate regulon response regulator PhoB